MRQLWKCSLGCQTFTRIGSHPVGAFSPGRLKHVASALGCSIGYAWLGGEKTAFLRLIMDLPEAAISGGCLADDHWLDKTTEPLFHCSLPQR